MEKEIFDKVSRKRQTVPGRILNELEEMTMASERYAEGPDPSFDEEFDKFADLVERRVGRREMRMEKAVYARANIYEFFVKRRRYPFARLIQKPDGRLLAHASVQDLPSDVLREYGVKNELPQVSYISGGHAVSIVAKYIERLLDIALLKTASCTVASELVKVAKLLTGAQPSFLNGMSKRQAMTAINKIMTDLTKGFHRDTAWRPINAVFKEFRELNVDYDNMKSEYRKDRDTGKLTSKEWKFTITFENQRGRDQILYGIIIASGAGSVDDPLERYDVITYVS